MKTVQRARRIIIETAKALDLDLKGRTVLTEVGTHNYLFSPIVPALCGAEKVYALAKDNAYGKAYEVIQECRQICDKLDLRNVHFLEQTIPTEILPEIDILTNSGNLRPINKSLLQYCKKDLVIPLMYEAWEFRNSDIDIDYCKDHGFKVAGTWEDHPVLQVFRYSGLLAMKMAFNAGFEIEGNHIFVWSNDNFGKVISEKFIEEGGKVTLSNDPTLFYQMLPDLDFVFLADYFMEGSYLSNGGILDASRVVELNPDIVFVHLFGNVDYKYCLEQTIEVFPKYDGKRHVMSYTLGYIGLIPILRLQVGGYRVAFELLENKTSDLTQAL